MFLCTLINVQCRNISLVFDNYHKMIHGAYETFIPFFGIKKTVGRGPYEYEWGSLPFFLMRGRIPFFTFLTLVCAEYYSEKNGWTKKINVRITYIKGFKSAPSLLSLKGPNYLRSLKSFIFLVHLLNSVQLSTLNTLNFGIFLVWIMHGHVWVPSPQLAKLTQYIHFVKVGDECDRFATFVVRMLHLTRRGESTTALDGRKGFIHVDDEAVSFPY